MARRAADEDEVFGRTVAVERDAWLDDPAAASASQAAGNRAEPSGPPPDGKAGMSLWQRARNQSTAIKPGAADLRSGRFPADYVPPEPEPAEEVAAVAEEEEEDTGPSSSKLLVQDSSTWGDRAPDYGDLG